MRTLRRLPALGLVIAATLEMGNASSPSGPVRLTVPGGRYAAWLDGTALSLESSDGMRARIRLVSVGRGARAVSPIRTTRFVGERVERVRDGVTEWYQRTPGGIEQGFTIDARPAGSGALSIELAVDGLTAETRHDDEALLRGATTSVSVSSLAAFDANGARLRSWMTSSSDRLSIHVDDANALYPLVVDPVYAVVETRLPDPSGGVAAGAGFGVSTAVSGTTAVIGASYNSDGAHVYVRSGTAWMHQAKLSGAGDSLSVAIHADTVVLGSKVTIGAARVWSRTGTTWTSQGALTPSENAADDLFGQWVAVDGNTAVVSATGADPGGVSAAGAVFVFVRSGASWTQQTKLVAPIPAVDQSFGSGVAVSGDTLVVGTFRGSAAHVFVRSGTAWTHQAELKATGATQLRAVGLRGDTMLLTSPPNAAYVFRRTGAAWVEEGKLVPSGVASTVLTAIAYGQFSALGTDVALIGANQDNPDAKAKAGSVYVFDRTGSTWAERTKLVAPDGVAGDWFGVPAIDGSLAVVGAFLAKPGGAAYSFSLPSTRAAGEACAENRLCTSGYCADSVCCNTACTGPCEACTTMKKGSGANGSCGPVAANTDPRERCMPGTGVCAADGMCDGAGSCRSFAKPGTTCGATTCSAGVVTGMLCKGDSADCAAATTKCSPYACSGNACATSCATSADCDAKLACNAGKCEAEEQAKCSDDGTQVLGPGALVTPCNFTRCRGGKCLETCMATEDCAAGYVCDNLKCVPPVTTTADEGGCALAPRRVRASAHGTETAIVVLVSLIASMARRRRAR